MAYTFTKYAAGGAVLWFRCNPFLRDSADREKRDHYQQITTRAMKPR